MVSAAKASGVLLESTTFVRSLPMMRLKHTQARLLRLFICGAWINKKKMGEPEDSLLSCGRMDDRNPDLLQVCPIKMQSRRSTTELYALVIWLLPMMRI